MACAAQPPPLTADAAVLVDPETRQVLYDHNGGKRAYPASLTKMMTALLVVEQGDLEQQVVVSKRAAAVGETTMNLAAAEQARLGDLLTGALLNSANDASVACAETIAGSVEAFVERMNQRAAELGMKSTRFLNPTGLHNDQHYSTARDLSLVSIEVMSRAELRPIVRMQTAQVPWPGRPYNRLLSNRNRLLAQWAECDGIKTGYTRQAGRCLAASAYRDGWRLICVVLNSEDAWTDARALLEYGFNSFYKVALVVKDITSATLGVRGGVTDTVRATATEDLIAVLPRGEQPSEPRLVSESCQAPVSVGELVGQLEVTMPDGRRRLVAAQAVEDVPQSLWAEVLNTPWMLAVMLITVALAAGGLAYAATAEALSSRRRRQSAPM